MGTYVNAAFGHSGDPERIVEITRALIKDQGFELFRDGLGQPDLSVNSLIQRWTYKGPWNRLHLENDRHTLYLCARGGVLCDSEVRFWVFASNGLMDNGLGREDVRRRTREIAGRFGGDRLLYVPDSTGINRLYDGVGIEEEEAFLEGLRPPLPWNHAITDAGIYMMSWFRESLA
jgi:hypothetical protein